MTPRQPFRSDWNPERVEAGLRGLPPPPVPSDLKDRLLAAFPEHAPRVRRPWRWFAGALAAAAAVLLAVFWWQRGGDARPDVIPRGPQIADKDIRPTPSAVAVSRPPMLAFRQSAAEGFDLPAMSFEWPVRETSPVLLAARAVDARYP